MPEKMTVKEVYEKYKHLDKILSVEDRLWIENPEYVIMHDLWQAVKGECEK
jgi:hypothetical protein